MKPLLQNNLARVIPMTGMHVTFKDGVHASVAELQIQDTYAGQMAGTLTVGTQHRQPRIAQKMQELETGKETGYFYLPVQLVEEAELRGLAEKDSNYLRSHTDLGMCLKEQHLIATLHISDPDYCHIIDLHWFQTGKELASTPLVTLIQEAVNQLAFADIYSYCQHEDWLDMF